MSVTEGEDKPLKYPTIVNSADLAVITKTDLGAAVEFDCADGRQESAICSPRNRNPEVSAKTGSGMDVWLIHRV